MIFIIDRNIISDQEKKIKVLQLLQTLYQCREISASDRVRISTQAKNNDFQAIKTELENFGQSYETRSLVNKTINIL